MSGLLKMPLLNNSIWGIISNIFQNILFSIFFIVIARKYSTADFSNYILANTLYSFVLAFSSLGLGQWFVREVVKSEDKGALINRFFKIQLIAGILFYFVNVGLAFVLYDSTMIRNLTLLVGVNLIFDNIIYVIKFVNIAELNQKRTFIILSIEALLKFLIACLLFVIPLQILLLTGVLIVLRFVTLNLFLRLGNVHLVSLTQIWKVKINFEDIKTIVFSNWTFVVIGSISVIYWRIGNILVSKWLTLKEVADYEISFKFFSIVQILPTIVSGSVFPLFVKYYENKGEDINKLYKVAFFIYGIYGLTSYTFMYSFSDTIIPFLFGSKYTLTAIYCKQMFLTMLVFPTALLQANLLIAMKLEKKDMFINLLSLLVNIVFCVIGLYYYKTLSVVNYAIFVSFLIFHLIQDFVLYKKQMISITHSISFYLISFGIVFLYETLSSYFNPYFLFTSFWLFIGTILITYYHNFYTKGSIIFLDK